MLNYKYVNVNPKNRKTGDCSTRAIVGAFGVDYDTALRLQYEAAYKTKYGITDKQIIEYIAKQLGWVKMKQPRKTNGKKYTVGEMDQVLTSKQMHQGVLITVANHHTCITPDCRVQDIWDCRNMSVGNYYVKLGN